MLRSRGCLLPSRKRLSSLTEPLLRRQSGVERVSFLNASRNYYSLTGILLLDTTVNCNVPDQAAEEEKYGRGNQEDDEEEVDGWNKAPEPLK